MSIQVKRRREAASFLATFTGAQAELVVDTTNNRVQIHDGVTAGGWPAAKLGEVVTNARTAVSDANYAALTTDRSIAFTAITAARTVTLPASSAYPTGTALLVFDESGSCSSTNKITISGAGSDTIEGATSAVVSSAYGFLALQSNGAGKWTVIDQATSNLATVGIGTPADPNNPLSVYGTSALFSSGGNFNVTVNKAAAADTASFIFEDGFSGRAQIGLCGDDNFHFKVSNNGSSWNTGLLIDSATGALTPGNARTAVSDANYAALATDREVAYTAMTAARTVTLPAAAAFPAGVQLVIADESGSCSATSALTIAAAASDTINGATSLYLACAYGFAALASNGSNKWTVVDLATGSLDAAVVVNPTGAPLSLPPSCYLYLAAVGSNVMTFDSYGGAGGAISPNAAFIFRGARGTASSPSAAQSGDTLGSFGSRGYGATAFTSTSRNKISFVAAQNWTDAAQGTYISFQVTADNTTSLVEAMRVDQTGYLGIGVATPACSLDAVGPIRSGTYTVATLPTGVIGAQVFVSNGRKVSESAGNGTGVLAVYSNGAWRRLSDDTAVAA